MSRRCKDCPGHQAPAFLWPSFPWHDIPPHAKRRAVAWHPGWTARRGGPHRHPRCLRVVRRLACPGERVFCQSVIPLFLVQNVKRNHHSTSEVALRGRMMSRWGLKQTSGPGGGGTSGELPQRRVLRGPAPRHPLLGAESDPLAGDDVHGGGGQRDDAPLAGAPRPGPCGFCGKEASGFSLRSINSFSKQAGFGALVAAKACVVRDCCPVLSKGGSTSLPPSGPGWICVGPTEVTAAVFAYLPSGLCRALYQHWLGGAAACGTCGWMFRGAPVCARIITALGFGFRVLCVV